VPTEALRQITLDRGAIADAVLLSDEAGWNQTPEDWAVFVVRGTVFGMRSDDRLVATAAVLPYGPNFAWLLAAYGVAGLVSMAAMSRSLDRRPHASAVACLAGLATAFAVLTSLAFDHAAGLAALVVGVAAIVLWGAASTALPPMLQAAAMRTAPDDPDGASGLYVAGFQVGIMAGSLTGGLLYEHAGLAVAIGVSTALVMVALMCVTAIRGLFEIPQVIRKK